MKKNKKIKRIITFRKYPCPLFISKDFICLIDNIECERYHGYFPDGDCRKRDKNHNEWLEKNNLIENENLGKEVLIEDDEIIL